jgi:tetratricopeptide (TPR) repeat protein
LIPDEHLSRDDLDTFLRGRLPKTTTADHLRHLLHGCPDCSELLRGELSRRRGTPPEGYSQVFLDTAAWVVGKEAPLALERVAAPGLSVRLQELDWPQRRLLVANDGRYRTWGLCERLIHESRQAIWSVHVDTIVDRARSALLVGEHLDSSHYGESHVHDLLAEGHAALANSLRLRSDFAAAHRHFRRAHELLAQGTGDDLEAIRVASLEASLLTTLGRFEQAVELLDRQVRRLVRYGEDQLRAKLLVQKGIALGYFDPEPATEVLRSALALIDARESPRLALCARHSLIWCLNACGHSSEALMQLHASRRLFRQFPDRWAQLQLQWTEARLAFDLGRVEEAEAAYQALWGEAFELDLRLETALISLDMIEVQIALGRFADAVTVASRLVDLLTAWKVHRRAMQAWSLLLEALRRQTASGELVGELARYLRRAWKNPDLEFPHRG